MNTATPTGAPASRHLRRLDGGNSDEGCFFDVAVDTDVSLYDTTRTDGTGSGATIDGAMMEGLDALFARLYPARLTAGMAPER